MDVEAPHTRSRRVDENGLIARLELEGAAGTEVSVPAVVVTLAVCAADSLLATSMAVTAKV